MSLIIRRVSIETYSHIGDCHFPGCVVGNQDNRQPLQAIKPKPDCCEQSGIVTASQEDAMTDVIIAETETIELPNFLATRLAYDRRDELFFTLLALMVRRGKTALVPKLLDKMQRASGDKVWQFNRFMARLIKFYGG